jgi:hypothetical protein
MEVDREEQLLNEISIYLTYNTLNNKFTWILDQYGDFENWQSIGGVLYRALFEGGPTKAIRGIGSIRHFDRPDEQRDIYIYISHQHGLENGIGMQMFGVSVGNRIGGNATNVIVQGASGVVRTLNDLFRDEYDIVYERRRAHIEHMQDFDDYLRGLDEVNNIHSHPIIRNNRRLRDQ